MRNGRQTLTPRLLLVEPDSKSIIGGKNVDWRVIEGGHEFAITRAEEVVRQVAEVWGL